MSPEQAKGQTRFSGGGGFIQHYSASRDGRFLILQPVEEAVTSPITLLLNWKP